MLHGANPVTDKHRTNGEVTMDKEQKIDAAIKLMIDRGMKER